MTTTHKIYPIGQFPNDRNVIVQALADGYSDITLSATNLLGDFTPWMGSEGPPADIFNTWSELLARLADPAREPKIEIGTNVVIRGEVVNGKQTKIIGSYFEIGMTNDVNHPENGWYFINPNNKRPTVKITNLEFSDQIGFVIDVLTSTSAEISYCTMKDIYPVTDLDNWGGYGGWAYLIEVKSFGDAARQQPYCHHAYTYNPALVSTTKDIVLCNYEMRIGSVNIHHNDIDANLPYGATLPDYVPDYSWFAYELRAISVNVLNPNITISNNTIVGCDSPIRILPDRTVEGTPQNGKVVVENNDVSFVKDDFGITGVNEVSIVSGLGSVALFPSDVSFRFNKIKTYSFLSVGLTIWINGALVKNNIFSLGGTLDDPQGYPGFTGFESGRASHDLDPAGDNGIVYLASLVGITEGDFDTIEAQYRTFLETNYPNTMAVQNITVSENYYKGSAPSAISVGARLGIPSDPSDPNYVYYSRLPDIFNTKFISVINNDMKLFDAVSNDIIGIPEIGLIFIDKYATDNYIKVKGPGKVSDVVTFGDPVANRNRISIPSCGREHHKGPNWHNHEEQIRRGHHRFGR